MIGYLLYEECLEFLEKFLNSLIKFTNSNNSISFDWLEGLIEKAIDKFSWDEKWEGI